MLTTWKRKKQRKVPVGQSHKLHSASFTMLKFVFMLMSEEIAQNSIINAVMAPQKELDIVSSTICRSVSAKLKRTSSRACSNVTSILASFDSFSFRSPSLIVDFVRSNFLCDDAVCAAMKSFYAF